jgi:pullulanase
MLLLRLSLSIACLLPALPVAAQECDGPWQQVLAPAAGTFAARAVWLDAHMLRWSVARPGGRYLLAHSARAAIAVQAGRLRGADAVMPLAVLDAPPAGERRFSHIGAGPVLRVQASAARLRTLHRGQLVAIQLNDDGTVREASEIQHAGALDALFAPEAERAALGAFPARTETRFRLWAPTAQRAALCVYRRGAAEQRVPLRRGAGGVWAARVPRDLTGHTYRYAVDVYVRGAGIVRNRVGDPYAVSADADGRHSYIADLARSDNKPAGWDTQPRPAVRAATGMAIYELHVRDFSSADESVPPALRGKYLAFTQTQSNGMRHLAALAAAGMTDVHLLPVFDFGSVPERGCVTPAIAPPASPDSPEPAAQVAASMTRDCYNWGYDPVHFNAPEGSYASDAGDGAVRIRELRQAVLALHRAGLRVGMDVVYNHMLAAGQDEKAVLDRIVPGYYHRLDAQGAVERSTCCANTATEHRMMAKLMTDSVALWARHYAIDSFRFDLMGHQPRAAMERLQRQVNAQAGRPVQLIGEGWDFGEVAHGARFVQAAQLSLGGAGIGTFSDRARDALRGGGPGDTGADQIARQGWVNGLWLAPNALAPATRAEDLMRAADLVRVGLAGTLRDYPMTAYDGRRVALREIDYHGQPAGYATAPGEVVNYVENHDNHTLFDVDALKLPQQTDARERARVQLLAAAVTAFSQGIAYFHAGLDVLRSKSLDRNSFESGDWFNRLDFSYLDNGFGRGLPPAADNGASYALYGPVLANPRIKPGPAEIALMRDGFRDLLRIRAGSSLFHLNDAVEVARRLVFHNTGPAQNPAVIVGELDGTGYPGAAFGRIVYFLNTAPDAQALAIPALRGRAWRLHPVLAASAAGDRRLVQEARVDAAGGVFTLPGRSAAVFVADPTPSNP